MELPTEQAAKKVAREIAKQISIDIEDEGLKDVSSNPMTAKKFIKRQSNRISTTSADSATHESLEVAVFPEACESRNSK
jgi:hypothetical protein